MGNKQEIKEGVNKGRRVYWFHCPRCGNSPEHFSKAGATRDKRLHKCDG